MCDVEEKFGNLNDFLRETRLEKISTRLNALGINSIAALATLQQKDVDNIRSMLKPVQAKIFDREIGERVIRTEQPVGILRSGDSQAPKPTRSTSPLRQCANDMSTDDDPERYMPDDCYAEFSVEQLQIMIEESTKCINILNRLIAEPVVDKTGTSIYTPGSLSRLQASKEAHIDRLRLMRRLLESCTRSISRQALFPPPIRSFRDPISQTIKRKLHFDPSIPEDNPKHKHKTYTKTRHNEEDLKRLRDAERQRFAELGSKKQTDTDGWTCKMCKQVNTAAAASCRDCKESRYPTYSYHAYSKPSMALDTYNRMYHNKHFSAVPPASRDYYASTAITAHTSSSSRFSNYYSAAPVGPEYYKHQFSYMGDPYSSHTSLRGSAVQQNGPLRSQPLKHSGTYDSTRMKSSLEASSSVVKADLNKARPPSPSRPHGRSTHGSARPQSPQPSTARNAAIASSSTPPSRASTPTRSAVTSKPNIPSRSSSTGRMNRSAAHASVVTHNRKWGV